MRCGPLAAGLGDEVGIGGLAGVAEMTVNPDQARELRIGGQCVAEPDLADGADAVSGQHHDGVEVAVGAALVVDLEVRAHMLVRNSERARHLLGHHDIRVAVGAVGARAERHPGRCQGRGDDAAVAPSGQAQDDVALPRPIAQRPYEGIRDTRRGRGSGIAFRSERGLEMGSSCGKAY